MSYQLGSITVLRYFNSDLQHTYVYHNQKKPQVVEGHVQKFFLRRSVNTKIKKKLTDILRKLAYQEIDKVASLYPQTTSLINTYG